MQSLIDPNDIKGFLRKYFSNCSCNTLMDREIDLVGHDHDLINEIK